jgi:hypothetical protein
MPGECPGAVRWRRSVLGRRPNKRSVTFTFARVSPRTAARLECVRAPSARERSRRAQRTARLKSRRGRRPAAGEPRNGERTGADTAEKTLKQTLIIDGREVVSKYAQGRGH